MYSINLGKKIVNAIIIALLSTNFIAIVSAVVNGQSDEIVTTTFFGLVRLAILGSILYFLYAGKNLAKWLIVISTLFSGITGFFASLLRILSLFLDLNVSFSVIDIINIFIYTIYIVIGVVLIVSIPVKNFLTYRCEECQKDSNENESES
ncbi:hypothetical protein [Anaerocolumna xylanovorans]|uniref:Uncharacterized protein n=1 Tax=Anaerocolumna xylanovorans DSM 12503 TaxID=1121345 RepID=A0A1M7Y374_9FIRM|nr:hypothetical protein [Anaerocolumna xylanovorans]SHO46610.1 hypothetical protein SAMN02745217_01229 [Anaerocolumna xylanovorans DSM 12503]